MKIFTELGVTHHSKTEDTLDSYKSAKLDVLRSEDLKILKKENLDERFSFT